MGCPPTILDTQRDRLPINIHVFTDTYRELDVSISSRALCLTTLSLAATCCAVQAEVLQFNFTGTVLGTDSWIPAVEETGITSGMPVSGSFSYDTAAPTDSLGTYILDAPYGLTISVGGHTIKSLGMYARIDNTPYIKALTLEGASFGLWDGHPYNTSPYGSIELRLAGFGGKYANALEGTALPTVIDLSRFSADPWDTGGFARVNDMGGFMYSIESLTAVPEPSTHALWLLGLAAMQVGLLRRRKNAQQIQG